MIKLKFEFNNDGYGYIDFIEFPPVTEKNSPISLTDYSIPETELLIVYHTGRILISEAGTSEEFDLIKIIDSWKTRIEKEEMEIGEIYERKFENRYFQGILVLERTND